MQHVVVAQVAALVLHFVAVTPVLAFHPAAHE
jgi:hypothetical protein